MSKEPGLQEMGWGGGAEGAVDRADVGAGETKGWERGGVRAD